eukprot:7333471-Heterocapsa_arctica.AAC.1
MPHRGVPTSAPSAFAPSSWKPPHHTRRTWKDPFAFLQYTSAFCFSYVDAGLATPSSVTAHLDRLNKLVVHVGLALAVHAGDVVHENVQGITPLVTDPPVTGLWASTLFF